MNYGWRLMTLYRRRIKTIPKKMKCRKAKWFSEEALQIAVEKKRSEKQRRKGKI